jgi:hypothetical protein
MADMLSLNSADIRDLLAVDRKLRLLTGNFSLETLGLYSSMPGTPERIILYGAFPRYYLSRNDTGFMIWTWHEDDHMAINPVETFDATEFYNALRRLVQLNAGTAIDIEKV